MANLLNLRWVRFTTVRHASGHPGTAQINSTRTRTRARGGSGRPDKRWHRHSSYGSAGTGSATTRTNSATATRGGSDMQWLGY